VSAGLRGLVSFNIADRYGDSVDNAVEENTSVFYHIIRKRWLPSARACGQ